MSEDLAFPSTPLIHLAFCFLLGWKDDMPFLEVPSVWEPVGDRVVARIYQRSAA